MKHCILIFSILLFYNSSLAQIPVLAWAKNAGGPDSEILGISTAIDLSGNVYTTGYFSGTMDFDSGTGTTELTANSYDGFVTKLDANGNFVWVYQFGGDQFDGGQTIFVDASGDIVIGGYFSETVQFDPNGIDTEKISFGGSNDGVIIKLHQNGNFVFAKQIGGASDDFINALKTDASNNIYLTGNFNNTADFDPGTGVFELTSTGLEDIFLAKFDVNGDLVWVNSFDGGSSDDSDDASALDIESGGNIYLAGEYGEGDSGNRNIFVIKLDNGGNPIWETVYSNSNINSIHSIHSDVSGDVYFSGSISETMDFDPLGVGFDVSGPDNFICKLNSTGGFLWAKGLQLNPYDHPVYSMALDINGNIFLTGYFKETVVVDPDTGNGNIYSNASSDEGSSMFVIKLANNGDYIWAQGFNAPESYGVGNFITTDISGNIYVTGQFSGTNNFATGICKDGILTAIGEWDLLVLKLDPTSVPTTCFGVYVQPVSTAACEGGYVGLTAIAGGTSRITYQWQQFNGTDFVDIFDQEGDPGADPDPINGYEGTNTPFLYIVVANGSGTEQYRCKISGEFVPDTFSDIATLTLSGSTTVPYLVANSGCGPGQFLLTAFGGSEGNYRWYDNSGVEIADEVNSTFITPLISVPTLFSVSKGTADCQSDPVSIEVNTNACAPVPGLAWVAQPHVTAGDININKMVIDGGDNIYATGDFRGTVDFDAGPGSVTLTTALPDVRENFVIKLTKDRNIVWVLSLGSTNINQTVHISLDGLGNIYLAGAFRGTVDFNPGPAIFFLTATSNFDMFITKLDIDGNFIWAKGIGGTGSNSVFVSSIASDGNGVYTTGSFAGTVDFDPNAGAANRTSAGSTFFSDIFISKLDASGNFGWAHRMGATSATDGGRAIKVDASGNIYSTGTFFGTVDFDPGAGVANLIGGGATDLYIHKLNNAGIFQWARTVGNAGVEIPYGLALDAAGNPHITGTFGTIITNQTVDFDPGAGTFNLVSNEGVIFILKLTTSGTFTWAKNFGGTFASQPNDITIDASGNVLITGYADGNSDFDPGTAVYKLKSNVSRDMVVAQLNANGDFSWAFNMQSTGLSYFNSEGSSIVTDSEGGIYTTGSFDHSTDLDPGNCTYPLFASDGTAFIQKIKPGIATLCFNLQPESVAGCSGTQAVLSVAAAGATNITYQWQKLNTTSSLFVDISDTGGYSGATTLNLTIDTNEGFGAGEYRCRAFGNFAADKFSNSASVEITNTPIPLVTAASSCTPASLTLKATGGIDGQYRWYTQMTEGESIAGEVNGSYTTPLLSASTTFYISTVNETCESIRVPLTITIGGVACTNKPPIIRTVSSSTTIAGIARIDLASLISDPDDNIDLTTLKIIAQPFSGANAQINGSILTIDYTGLSFSGQDKITIEVCDLLGSCTQQELTINVADDVFVFNGMSPNGDLYNEKWVIQNIELLPDTQSNHVSIYNRWGDEVFSIDDYDNNGRVFIGLNKNGNKLSSGVYFYRIKFNSDRKELTGYLTLKR